MVQPWHKEDEYADLGVAIEEKARWWGIVDRIASALKTGTPSLVAYHGTVWNLLTGDWFETLNPLEVCKALEFSEDMDTAHGRCLDARDFDQGEVEVIFRAKIDLGRAERHGDEIWVLDPSAVSEQQARAIVGDDQWTDWMDSGDLWTHLLSINGLLPGEAMVSALAAARRMID